MKTLGRVHLFRRLNDRQLKSLAKATTTRTFEPEQIIVEEGQVGFGLFCIESGKVRVTQETPNGSREVRTMGAGECFGELSLIDDQPRAASVIAVEPTTTVVLDKVQFGVELRNHPDVSHSLLVTLVQWLREADRKISDLA